MSFDGAWSDPVVAGAYDVFDYPFYGPRVAYALSHFEKPWSDPVQARYSVAARLVAGVWRSVVIETFTEGGD